MDVVPPIAPTPEFPRRFVALGAAFDEWVVAEPYFRDLAERALNSVPDLERWLLDFSELDSAFDEENTRRYTAMTCQTDDSVRSERFLYFCEHVKPHREPWAFKLQQKYVAAAQRLELPPKRYEVLTRNLRNAMELFRDENVPLEVEDEKLTTEYQQVTGGVTVPFDGQERTIPQLNKFQEEPDRTVREAAWRAGAEAFLARGPALDGQYEKLVALRHRIAQNADCSDYRAYRFRDLERFDYSPQDCLTFHAAIESVVLPAARSLNEQRRRRLNVETLRPWDLSVDPDNRPPLRPFEEVSQLIGGCERIFSRVHIDLGRTFSVLVENDMLDLASRKGKAPGGYQTTLHERRMPFIFMNAVGTDDDVRTLLHEGGHAFHTWACRSDPWLQYRNYPTEFAEVASMGMECLSLAHTHTFYGDDDPRARRAYFEGVVLFFPFMACVDAFQHFVYTHVDAGLEAWSDHWQLLQRRFNAGVDWTGLESFARRSWHRKLHIFEVPFYYVEYGIAQLGALQVWLNSKKDYAKAVAHYRQGLSLGGSRPLPELFETAGCRFDFSEGTLRPLIAAAMEEIARCDAEFE